jgi:hypothetical protein
MSTQLQLRRGTAAQTAAFIGASGEMTVSTDDHVPHVHDGATPGGFPLVLGGVIANYASLPASPQGLWIVQADETKGGVPSAYYFYSTHAIWIAAVQVA